MRAVDAFVDELDLQALGFTRLILKGGDVDSPSRRAHPLKALVRASGETCCASEGEDGAIASRSPRRRAFSCHHGQVPADSHRPLAGLPRPVAVEPGTVMRQTLRWAAQGDVLTLDPHSQDHAATNAALGHVYEGLVRYSRSYKIEGALAVEWKAVSPTTMRFVLRPGVKFHEGQAFTAADVVFSFARVRQPTGTHQTSVSGIGEIRVRDDYTIDVISDKHEHPPSDALGRR